MTLVRNGPAWSRSADDMRNHSGLGRDSRPTPRNALAPMVSLRAAIDAGYVLNCEDPLIVITKPWD